MLELSMADLIDQLPHAGGSPVAKLPVFRTLREQLDQLETLKTTRDALTLRASSMIGLTRSIRIERNADGLVGMILVDTPKEEQGVRVASCEPDGPAAKAGVNVGDIILKINEEEATFHQQASDLIRSLAPAPIDLFVQRAAHDQVLAFMQACTAWACTLPTPSPPSPQSLHSFYPKTISFLPTFYLHQIALLFRDQNIR